MGLTAQDNALDTVAGIPLANFEYGYQKFIVNRLLF